MLRDYEESKRNGEMKNMVKKLVFYISIMATVLCGCGSEATTVLTEGDALVEESGSAENAESDISLIPERELTAFEKLFEEGPMIASDDNNKVGYIDINGEYVIQPQFKRGKKFSEGYAAVQDTDSGKWGFIDESGNYVIEPQYTEARSFFDGTALVSTDFASWGMIDVQGNYIIEPVYEDVSYYKEGYALVTYTSESTGERVYRFVDEAGNLVFDEYADAYLFENGITVVGVGNSGYIYYYYFLKTNGELETRFDESPASFPSNILYGSGSSYGKLNRYLEFDGGQPARFEWGQCALVNEEGEVISPYYEYISGGKSTSGLREASITDENSGRTLHGYVDENYNWAIEPAYDSCGFFNYNCDYTWTVNYDTCFYLIDKQGNQIMDSNPNNHNGISASVTDVTSNDLLNGPISATNSNNMTSGYINQNYEEVIPFIYDETTGFSSDKSYAMVKYDGKWGVIDSQGNWLIEPKFSTLFYE